MPDFWAGVAADRQHIGFLSSAAVALMAGAFLVFLWLRKVPTAEEVERRRRTDINRNGKLADAEVIDIEGASVLYSYQIAGVGYTASQDVSALCNRLPDDLASTVGPAVVKFDRRNPANSIIVCEDWNGLRIRETKR